MLTRKEYMDAYTGETDADRDALHRQYYAQLVSNHTIGDVVRFIGSKKLQESKDKHFNDIPLDLWDRCAATMLCATSFQKLGDYATKSGLVCVAKEAAQQHLDSLVK